MNELEKARTVYNTVSLNEAEANGFTRKLIDEIEKINIPESADVNSEELLNLISIYEMDLGKFANKMFKLGFSRGLKMSNALELADSLD